MAALLIGYAAHGAAGSPHLGGSVYDPTDPVGRLLFNVLAMVGAGDAEQVGELSGAVIAAIEQSQQLRFLSWVELGLLAAQTPFGLGDLHPPPG
jgi:hypothetical protein